MDRALIREWKPRLQAVDPWRVMTRDEVDALYAERPDAPSDRVAQALLLAVEPRDVKIIFCGARGSGKSTELTRVGTLVQEDFAAVQLDVIAALHEGQSSLAILTMIGVGALRAVHDWTRPDADLAWPPPSAIAPLAEALENALSRFGVAAGVLGAWVVAAAPALVLHTPEAAAAAAAVGVGSRAAGTVARWGSDLMRRLPEVGRGDLGRALDPAKVDDAREVVAAVQAILDALEDVAGRTALLLVDGLDQLDSIDQIKAAVADAHLLSELRTPIVFTGPIQLRHHEHFSGLPGRFRPEVLHNLSVVTHDDNGDVVDGPDITVLERAYARRAQAAGLGASLITPSLLRRLARASSGVVREFFLLIEKAGKAAVEAGRHAIASPDVDAACRAQRHFLQLALNEPRSAMLGRILLSEQMVGGDDGEVLLFGNYVACYQNDNLWFRPHELLVEYIRRQLPAEEGA